MDSEVFIDNYLSGNDYTGTGWGNNKTITYERVEDGIINYLKPLYFSNNAEDKSKFYRFFFEKASKIKSRIDYINNAFQALEYHSNGFIGKFNTLSFYFNMTVNLFFLYEKIINNAKPRFWIPNQYQWSGYS